MIRPCVCIYTKDDDDMTAKSSLNSPFGKASTVIITYFVKDHIDKEKNKNALDWEKRFVAFMQEYASKEKTQEHMDVAFTTARSIEDEIEKASRGEMKTIIISYLVMFFYISINLRENYSIARMFVSFFFSYYMRRKNLIINWMLACN